MVMITDYNVLQSKLQERLKYLFLSLPLRGTAHVKRMRTPMPLM